MDRVSRFIFCCIFNRLCRFFRDFCVPVVVTLATAEVEKICLQNGLLLHELLRYEAYYALDTDLSVFVDSCFGQHIVDVSATIRIGKQSVPLNDPRLRFERATEVKQKSSEVIESVS
jgi:hypothetical protein